VRTKLRLASFSHSFVKFESAKLFLQLIAIILVLYFISEIECHV